MLLAQIVQRSADRPYRAFLADRIFDRLGLTQTFAGMPTARPNLALGHDADGQPLPTWELDVVGMGTGDVWSTANDMLTWLDALQRGRLLSEPYRTLMLTEQARTGKGPEESGYGYGVFLGEVNNRRWWHHSGHNAGYKTFVGHIPELDRRFVVLSNTEATTPSILEPLLT